LYQHAFHHLKKDDVTGDCVQPYLGNTARMMAKSSLKHCLLHVRRDSAVMFASVCEHVNVNIRT